jgi:general secretion pathway protein M
MIVTVREWYVTRSEREQRLILLMLAIALPLLAWLLVVRPLETSYDRALDAHLAAVDRNGRVRALAATPRDAGVRSGGVAEGDLGLIVAEAATQAGFALDSSAAAGPDAVTVTIASARAPAAVQWLRDFELRGIRVEDLRMNPAADGTVSLNARLVRVRA